MLERSDPLLLKESRPVPRVHVPEKTVSVAAAWAIIGRHRALFLLAFLPIVTAGILYAALASPRYTATSVLLIDTRARNPNQQTVAVSAAVESANVDSQVEVLRSESVIRSVVETLDLPSDPEFAPVRSALWRWGRAQIKDWFGLDLDAGKTNPIVIAIGVIEKNLIVKRLGLSYVIQIDYKSSSALRAAEISNRIVEQYIALQVEARQAAEKDYNDWLERRATALGTIAVQTERALADWKRTETMDRIARAYTDATRRDGATLQQNIDRAAEEMAQAAKGSADLKGFESAAQTSRALADSFAKRLGELAPQTSGSAAEARVISKALPPIEKSEPKPFLILGAALALGALGGFGAAFVREKTSKGIRSARQVEEQTGLPCLGTVARMPNRAPKGSRQGSSELDAAMFRVVLAQPASRFAETVRAIRAGIRAAPMSRPAQIMAVVSALPGEGKSVVAANLGHICAVTGMRTLLIDLDLRRCGLTRRVAPDAQVGIAEVVAGKRAASDAIWRDPESGLHVLPATALSPADAFGTLSSTAVLNAINAIAQQFDLVILDFPAILSIPDALPLAPAIDSYVLVAAWGETETGQILDGIRKMPEMRERTLGIVLNRADPKILRQEECALGAYA